MSKCTGPARRSEREDGFTLVELLVVIAIIALLMGVLLPALNRAREQGKRAVCLSYQKQMVTSWMMYADDSEDKIVNGDSEEYGAWNEPPCTGFGGACLPGGIHFKEKPWILCDWRSPPCWPAGTILTTTQKKDQLTKGALFRYVKDVKAYKCPRAEAKETRSFSVVDGMNVTVINPTPPSSPSGVGSGAVLIKNRQQIKKTYERMIYIDDGGVEGSTWGGWTVYVSRETWWDPPSARHGDGTTFSFADGHSEYHKWLDPRTFDAIKIKLANPTATIDMQPGNKDIRWSSVVAWGSDVAGKGN
jgi:prepilin-type N-terminal cleavage/methylation domain-containing protein/prepilin-type processing-associated H-X9-DG protein